MDFDSNLMIPVTIYGMRVTFLHNDTNVISTKDFPFRDTLTSIKNQHAIPNNLTIVSMVSTKQIYSVNCNEFSKIANLSSISQNKKGYLQKRDTTKYKIKVEKQT